MKKMYPNTFYFEGMLLKEYWKCTSRVGMHGLATLETNLKQKSFLAGLEVVSETLSTMRLILDTKKRETFISRFLFLFFILK